MPGTADQVMALDLMEKPPAGSGSTMTAAAASAGGQGAAGEQMQRGKQRTRSALRLVLDLPDSSTTDPE
jgi:hypothetical protein